MDDTYKRVVLARYLDGMPQPADFRIEETPMPVLAEGQCLVRNVFASLDPGTRSRLSKGPSYAPPLSLGDTVGAFNIGVVEQSRNPRFDEGDLLACAFGWAEYGVTDGRGFVAKITDRDVPLSAWIGVLGVPGMTAYFGLKRVGALAPGQTVVVTSAAGMVGATAGQIAKLHDCRVIGVAGGPTKCAWLTDAAGFDAAIDYKSVGDLTEAVRAACPDGVDILFDNVGNRSVDAILPLMNMRGRIVVSGQVGDYNLAPEDVHGVRNTRPFITHRVRMEGLVVFDDIRQFPEAQRQVADWLKADRLIYRERIYDGVAAAPGGFRDVFEGVDFGRHLVRLGPDPA